MQIGLNLLPPHKKKELRKSLILAHFQLMTFICLIVAIGLVGTLVLVRGQVKHTFDDVQARAAAIPTDQSTDITEKIRQINIYLKGVNELQNKYVSWSEVVDKLTALVPPKVRLELLTINEGGEIHMNGMATTRDDALALLKRLKETDYLTDVVSPLSNILQKENVNFEFTMTYSPLKQQEPSKQE
jgi:Tfp pilus assembly protein PilN